MYIASGSFDKTLRIWDPLEPDASRACVRELRRHTDVSMLCACFCFSPVIVASPLPMYIYVLHDPLSSDSLTRTLMLL